MALVESKTAAAASSVTFTDLDSTGFVYEVIYDSATSSSDNDTLIMLTSANNGSSYDNGASNYAYVCKRTLMNSSETEFNFGSDAGTSIVLATGVGNATNESVSGEVKVINPSGANHTKILFHGTGAISNGTKSYYHGGGARLSAATVDAIEIKFNTGTITGTFKLYKRPAS